MAKKAVSVMSKIFIAVLAVILFVMLFFNLSTRLAVYKINRGYLVESGYASVIVVSGSMEPAISEGDLLIIKSKNAYINGDIVTYVSDSGSLITHRVEEVLADGYITHGDANNVADGEISAQKVMGKTIFVLPSAGVAIRWLSSPISIVLLCCIVVLLWLIIRLSTQAQED